MSLNIAVNVHFGRYLDRGMFYYLSLFRYGTRFTRSLEPGTNRYKRIEKTIMTGNKMHKEDRRMLVISGDVFHWVRWNIV